MFFKFTKRLNIISDAAKEKNKIGDSILQDHFQRKIGPQQDNLYGMAFVNANWVQLQVQVYVVILVLVSRVQQGRA